MFCASSLRKCLQLIYWHNGNDSFYASITHGVCCLTYRFPIIISSSSTACSFWDFPSPVINFNIVGWIFPSNDLIPRCYASTELVLAIGCRKQACSFQKATSKRWSRRPHLQLGWAVGFLEIIQNIEVHWQLFQIFNCSNVYWWNKLNRRNHSLQNGKVRMSTYS